MVNIKLSTYLMMVSLVCLLITGIYEYSLVKTSNKITDHENWIDQYNQKVSGFVQYQTMVNQEISTVDILLATENPNLINIITSKSADVKESKMILIRRLENETKNLPQPISFDNYDDVKLREYEQKLIKKWQDMADAILDKIMEFRQQRDKQQYGRNVFFIVAIIFEILSLYLKDKKK